jgi:hypothetical protein
MTKEKHLQRTLFPEAHVTRHTPSAKSITERTNAK